MRLSRSLPQGPPTVSNSPGRMGVRAPQADVGIPSVHVAPDRGMLQGPLAGPMPGLRTEDSTEAPGARLEGRRLASSDMIGVTAKRGVRPVAVRRRR